MITFRYHLVSIAAVLLALAAGVALGAGVLDAPPAYAFTQTFAATAVFASAPRPKRLVSARVSSMVPMGRPFSRLRWDVTHGGGGV